MNWLNPNTHWPDWRDSQKRIEFEDEDGQRYQGVLVADDVVFEECPVFVVECDDGVKRGFVGCNRWRII